MKGRVEAGHLGQPREARRQCIDCRQIVRLVQRRQRYQRAQVLQDLRIDEPRRDAGNTPMRHAMPCRRQSIGSEMRLDPFEEMREQLIVRRVRVPGPIRKTMTEAVLRRKMRSGADAFDFTMDGAAQRLDGAPGEQRKLDAGRSCIDDQQTRGGALPVGRRSRHGSGLSQVD